jgi:hypothetical protein
MLKNWILKVVLRMVAKFLESKFPGLTPIVERLIAFLLGGGNGHVMAAHMDKLPEFQAGDIKRY